MTRRRLLCLLCAAVLASLAVASVSSATPSQAVNKAAPGGAPAFTADDLNAAAGDNWLNSGGGIHDNRYSTLSQITKANVAGLKTAWTSQFDLTTKVALATSEEASASAYNGVLYIPDGQSEVYAVDGATGQHLWKYSPVLDEPPFIPAIRGVALGDGKVYEAQGDGNIVALDQATGNVVWKSKLGNPSDGLAFSAAPVYYNGMIIAGMSGGDWGGRSFVVAVDAKTGMEDWRHYIVPGPGELGTGSWGVTDWIRGGGALWIYPSIDSATGQVYVVTGNPIPWNGRGPGNNYWTDSIIALHVQNGQFSWAFQTVHHDIWDYDVTNPPVIFDAMYGGVLRHGIAVASKTGWVYILDRISGQPLLGIVEKKVPQLKGAAAAYANTSKTQPYPVGDAFVPQCSSKKVWSAPALDGKPFKTGCIFTPYAATPQGSFIASRPAAEGGVDWPPSAFNPQTNQIYLCFRDSVGAAIGAIVKDQIKIVPGQLSLGVNFGPGPKKYPDTGGVVAMDVTTNKLVWKTKWPLPCFSGVMNTATGLVFVGQTKPSEFDALDASTGQKLWASPALLNAKGVTGPSITYTAGGKQYVVVLAGNNIYAFSL